MPLEDKTTNTSIFNFTCKLPALDIQKMKLYRPTLPSHVILDLTYAFNFLKIYYETCEILLLYQLSDPATRFKEVFVLETASNCITLCFLPAFCFYCLCRESGLRSWVYIHERNNPEDVGTIGERISHVFICLSSYLGSLFKLWKFFEISLRLVISWLCSLPGASHVVSICNIDQKWDSSAI